jgi:hypothetical protein
MKSLFVTAAVALTAVSSKFTLVKEEAFDDIEFMNKVHFNLYNGFVRGLYHEHTQKVVDEKCFGDWIKSDMTHLNGVLTQFFNFDFPIVYDDAIKASTEVVNLFYMN